MIRRLAQMVLLLAAAYIGYLFAVPQVRAWRFKDAMNQTARLASASSREGMRTALLEAADELGVPLTPHRLRIEGTNQRPVRIVASWEEIVRVPGWKLGDWVDTLRFEHVAEERER